MTCNCHFLDRAEVMRAWIKGVLFWSVMGLRVCFLFLHRALYPLRFVSAIAWRQGIWTVHWIALKTVGCSCRYLQQASRLRLRTQAIFRFARYLHMERKRTLVSGFSLGSFIVDPRHYPSRLKSKSLNRTELLRWNSRDDLEGYFSGSLCSAIGTTFAIGIYNAAFIICMDTSAHLDLHINMTLIPI
jgi:hypothetical protein